MKIKAKIIALIMLVTAICAISLVGCGLQTYVNRKLTFEVDGAAYKIVVTDGKSAVELPQDPSKTGYAFGGWYYDKDEWTKEFKADSLVEEPLTANLIVYAKWNELTYEVKFVSDGETIKTETVEYGASATAPADLTKTGYTFAGWDKAFDNVTENLTVTAKWNINTYTVTFVSEGETIKAETVNYGSSATAPDLTKTGYTFAGWDKAFDNVTENLTVTAKWNINTYTVTFVSDGETIKAETVEYGASATAPADLTKTGYTFAGWDKEFTNIEDNLTVTAIWMANKYAVTLNANDATACEALTEYTYGQGATLPVPQKTGYTFNGWFVAEDFTGEAVTEIGATDSGDKAFFAKWTINVYTVKFINANGDELKSEQIEYGNMPAYDGEPALESDAKWVYTFKGWHKEVEVATKNTAYVATYTKAENLGNVYECTYNDEYAGYVFENTTFVGDAEWKVTMTAENFLKDGGVKLVSDTGSYIAITNDQKQAIYMLASGIEGVEGYMNGKGHQKGGENVTFTMTFKFVKVGAKIYGYADNIHIATYASDKIADMFGEHELHLETYRGTAVTGKLSFKTTATKRVYAVNGSTACTDKFEGLTTTDNFTFTASVQGTGLYTYAGIRIWCGEDYVNFYSHTFPDAETVINFDGWNRPTVKTSIALQNSDKATYKVVKTSNNMSFYLNDTLIFEMGPNYSLNANWGEKFFKEGAVYTFGQYVEAGSGSGYYTEINLETVKNVKIAIQGGTACADKFEGYKAANEFTFTATVQGTGLYTYAGIRIWCGDNFIDFYSHTYGGNATFVKFGNIDENGGKAFNVAPVLTSVNIANAEKGVYKVVKTSEKLSLYVNDTLIFEFDKDFNLARDWGARFFEDGAVYTFGQYVEAGPGGSGYYCDLGLEY